MSQKKALILGCCPTGAKFTPKNHKLTGNRILDAICSGDLIPVSFEDIGRELDALLSVGCRYWHIHARNPQSREQSCDNSLYSFYGSLGRKKNPDLLISFGGSRNGVEIVSALQKRGEWDRISQVALHPAKGGANFVTFQAAIELQIVCDLERQGFVEFDHSNGQFHLLKSLADYVPSRSSQESGIEVYSTDNGGNYGKSSAHIQYDTLLKCIIERSKIGQPFEVEWVQHARSRFLTWFMVHHLASRDASIDRLNISLLFGFSPRLPFPLKYENFKRVVNHARQIAKGHPRERDICISVSVGCAVLPQHSADLTRPMDVGPLKGQVLSPLDRLIAYASEPDSGVDIMRVGLEDTPYFQDANYTILPTTNVHLAKHARMMIERLGGEIVIDKLSLRNFAAARQMADA